MPREALGDAAAKMEVGCFLVLFQGACVDLHGSDRREGIWGIGSLWCLLAISSLSLLTLMPTCVEGEMLCSRACRHHIRTSGGVRIRKTVQKWTALS